MIYFTDILLLQIYFSFGIMFVPKRFFYQLTREDSDELPVGLLAQWVERCTRITKVMGSNPVQAWIFFQALFSLLLK